MFTLASRSNKKDGENVEFVQIGVLEAEFDKCRKQLFGELQKAHDRIADLDKEVNQKSGIIVNLNREVTEQKDNFAKNIASKEERLRILSLEVNEKHTKNNELKKENDMLERKYDKEIKYLQTLNIEHKKNIERLNNHIKKMNVSMKNVSCKHRKETEQLEYDLNETRHAFTCKENEIKVRSTELEYQIYTLETEKRKLGELVKTLKTEVKNLKSTQEQLEQRLSKVANLTYNNPNIADLSDEKRPTKLAEAFSELYDNEWTDAFEELDFGTEKGNTKFLLDILMKTNAICSDLSNGHTKRIKDAFCRLTTTSHNTVTSVVKRSRVEKKVIPTALQKGDNVHSPNKRSNPNEEESKDSQSDEEQTGSTAVEFETDYGLATTKAIRIYSDFELLQTEQKKTIMDAKNFFENLLATVVETKVADMIVKEFQTDTEKTCLQTYITKCVNICWSMYRHNPPVFIALPDIKESAPYDTSKYRGYQSSGKFIDFIVWPALCLHEGGPLLCRGVAQGLENNKSK